MKAITGVSNYFNGKKTMIGLVLYFILGGSLQIGLIDQAMFDSISQFAQAAVGIGLLHKGYKAV